MLPMQSTKKLPPKVSVQYKQMCWVKRGRSLQDIFCFFGTKTIHKQLINGLLDIETTLSCDSEQSTFVKHIMCSTVKQLAQNTPKVMSLKKIVPALILALDDKGKEMYPEDMLKYLEPCSIDGFIFKIVQQRGKQFVAISFDDGWKTVLNKIVTFSEFMDFLIKPQKERCTFPIIFANEAKNIGPWWTSDGKNFFSFYLYQDGSCGTITTKRNIKLPLLSCKHDSVTITEYAHKDNQHIGDPKVILTDHEESIATKKDQKALIKLLVRDVGFLSTDIIGKSWFSSAVFGAFTIKKLKGLPVLQISHGKTIIREYNTQAPDTRSLICFLQNPNAALLQHKNMKRRHSL